MSNAIEYEPYLSDYDVVFHGIFTLIDPAMNTSEIKPLHLAVPRNRQGMRLANPATASPTAAAAVQSRQASAAAAGDKKSGNAANTRFLAQRYLTSGSASKATTVSSPSQRGASPQKIISQTADKILPPEKPPQTAAEQPAAPPKAAAAAVAAPKTAISPNDNKVVTEMLLKNDDYWLMPLSPSIGVRFKFYVDGKSGPGFTFNLALETDNKVILSARMNGATRSSGIGLFVDDKNVGETHYTQGNSSFFAGVDAGRDERSEACAAVFNPSFSSASQPRVFDFLVPALKKISGKSRMFPIVFSETSGLVTRLSQMSKEAIRLKTRIPISQGNSFDMTFDGKFSMPSLSNFILYHDSNTRKDLCSLGMVAEGDYNLEIGYPLSPLQGFLAAVAATMPV